MVEDPYGPWVKGILILAGLFFLVFGLSDYICPTANRNSKEESQWTIEEGMGVVEG